KVTQLPTGGLTSWAENQLGIKSMSTLVSGTADINLVKTSATDSTKIVKFAGDVDIASLVKGIANNSSLPIPSLNLTNPEISYKLNSTGKVYDFKSDTITINYETNTDGSIYDFTAKKLPLGGLTTWLDTQLGLKNLGSTVTGTTDIQLSKTSTTDASKSVKFSGDVNIASLIKGIAGDSLPVPDLTLKNPQVIYKTNTTGKVYDFTSDTINVNYTSNTDGTYDFNATKLPIGGLNTWLSNELGFKNFNLATGTVDVNLVKTSATDSTKKIKFSGDVNIASLIQGVAGNSITVPDLTLKNPQVSYKTTSTGKVYDFTSDTINVNYTSNTDGTYSLTANKLPTGGLTSWANTQLGVPGLDKLVTGDADLDLVKTNATDSSKVIKFTGSVDLSKLITAVSGNTSSLVIPSLSSQNPKLTYKTGTTGTIYDFDSETIDVRYEKNTDGTVYDFTAKQLPVGGLTSWVETTLGLKDFSNLVTGTVNIA
ncbi:MAG: hypothetical protein ACRC2J_03385, partial [Microcoleaceae cyanobacterium]